MADKQEKEKKEKKITNRLIALVDANGGPDFGFVSGTGSVLETGDWVGQFIDKIPRIGSGSRIFLCILTTCDFASGQIQKDGSLLTDVDAICFAKSKHEAMAMIVDLYHKSGDLLNKAACEDDEVEALLTDKVKTFQNIVSENCCGGLVEIPDMFRSVVTSEGS